ncbi:hypothetical protein JCM10207_008982, partial [Rhodosporidiobolus poonsookiae]
PKYGTFWASTFRFLGARMLSRTGTQLYEKDRFLPSSFNPYREELGAPAGKKCGSGMSRLLPVGRGKEKAEPLLKILADPRYSFYRALSRFEKIEVYANTTNDRTVPFPTGAFEEHDPFALARAKAQKVAEKRYDPEDKEVDFKDGGLDVKLRSEAPIISSYRYVDEPVITSASTSSVPFLTKVRRRLPKLPMLLRPSSYPVARWKGTFVVVFLPILLPALFSFLVVRFSLQGRQSRRRIALTREQRAEGREGMLQRIGISVVEAMEEGGLENPEYAARLDEPPADERVGDRDGAASARTSGTATPVGANGNGNGSVGAKEGKLVDFTSSSASSRPSSAASSTGSSAAYSTSSLPPSTRRTSPFPAPSASDLSLAASLRTDPTFSPSQHFQLEHLNALPQLEKFLVHMPTVRHTHGAIVRRDPGIETHRQGKKVVDAWARGFRV